ncbi:MAG: DinB family protein [Candidatus Hodarchaeota archaeon]
MYKYLFQRQSKRRKYILQKLDEIPTEDLRKRVHPNKWSIEELIRHIIFTTDFWIKRIALQDATTPFHVLGVENDTQASSWFSLNEIAIGFDETYAKVKDLLESNPDYTKQIIVPEISSEAFTIKWILWHILQHELETWGQIAERIRNYGFQTLWEF